MRELLESALRPLLSGLALAAVLVACGGDASTDRLASAESSREALVERLIAEDPQVLLDRSQLFKKQPVFTWKLNSATAIAPWQTRGLAKARLGKGQWLLEAAGNDPRLVRPVKLDPTQVHVLEVTLSGLRKGKATLFWAAAGEDFSDEKSLTAAPPKGRRQRPFTLTFDLAGHRLWGGVVERLRLDPTDAAEDKIALRSIRGVRRVADPERLAATLGRAWKIDLHADTRNALLAVPGLPFEHELDVGPGQRLQLSYGLEETVQQAVEFAVEATAEDESTAAVLLQETLTPAAGGAGSWRDATLDLSAYAGRRLRLKLETRSPELLDLARGFAAWANPEVLGPATDDERPNVILISLDTLRSDRLSAYGHHRETSPNLDRWAASSAVLFENAVVQAPWTLPSHASMFTGLEALRHDVNHYQEAPATLEMLAETLRQAGYATAAITGGGYLRPRFGFAQGFDMFRYWPQILAERELADGSDRMLRWLDENHARRFLLLFHTYEVHFPHRRRQPYFDHFYQESSGGAGDAPSGGTAGESSQPKVDALQCGRANGEIRGKLTMRARTQTPENPLWQHDYFAVELPSGELVEHLKAAEKELIRTCYDSAIAYTDEVLGRLFERLEALGIDGRTLIVLTSDHGEALGEKDRAGHNYHEDYNVMVPLVIEFPDGLGAGRRIDRQVRSIDIVPTILDALGIPHPQPLDGVSLLPLIRGDSSAVPDEAWTYASSANYGLGLRYRNQLKYIFNNTAWSRFLGQEALYNLRRDPEEENDLAARHPSAGELRAKAIQAIEAQHEGLRMRIRNHGEGTLSGRLQYAWARHNKVKAADTSCRCLRLGRDRTVSFELPPGQETTLYFESIAGHRMGLEGRLELPGKAPAPFEEVFDPNKLADRVVFEHTADGWHRSSVAAASPGETSPGEAPVAFTIWRQSQRAGQPVSQPVDARLQQQLEALGYVN